jgi:hypothetical protein
MYLGFAVKDHSTFFPGIGPEDSLKAVLDDLTRNFLSVRPRLPGCDGGKTYQELIAEQMRDSVPSRNRDSEFLKAVCAVSSISPKNTRTPRRVSQSAISDAEVLTVAILLFRSGESRL